MTTNEKMQKSLGGLSLSLSVLFKHVNKESPDVHLTLQENTEGTPIVVVSDIPPVLKHRVMESALQNAIGTNHTTNDKTRVTLVLSDRVTADNIEGTTRAIDAFHRSLLGVGNDASAFSDATQALNRDEQANSIRHFINCTTLDTKLRVSVASNPQDPTDPPSAARPAIQTAASDFNRHIEGFTPEEQKMALGLFLKAINIPDEVKHPFLGRAGALPPIPAEGLWRN